MENKKAIYLDGLNGVRAIAALAVVGSHITLHLANFNLNPFIFGAYEDGNPRGLSLAGYGVTMFFALSGFLITYLLLLEKKEKGKINIRFFYTRRILRIWPLYYFVMIISLLATYYTGTTYSIYIILFYVFYAPNILFARNMGIPVMAHYWSLGVEEQFYLFWPWVVAKVKRKLEWVIVVSIVVIIGLKLSMRFFYPGHDKSLVYQFIHVTRFHCMLVGALGAVLYTNNNTIFIKIFTHKLSQLVAWGVIFAAAINKFHMASVLDDETISVITLIIIMGQATKVNRLINLQAKVPDFLGKISYGIYIYHPLIIWGASSVLANIGISGVFKYIIVYTSITAVTIGVAYLSFTYIEKWFLKLKMNYTIIDSSK